jgi:hypothetical protein
MSKMSELHAEVVEMVEDCVCYDTITEFMVSAGFPREACRAIIDQIAGDIDEQERAAEIAAEASYY